MATCGFWQKKNMYGRSVLIKHAADLLQMSSICSYFSHEHLYAYLVFNFRKSIVQVSLMTSYSIIPSEIVFFELFSFKFGSKCSQLTLEGF